MLTLFHPGENLDSALIIAKMRQGGVQKYTEDRHGSGWSRSPLSPQKAAGSFP